MKKFIIVTLSLTVFAAILFVSGRLKTPQFTVKEKVKSAFEHIVKQFPFTKENSLKEWEEKILKGRVVYKIEKTDSMESFVRADSAKTASALFYKLNMDVKKEPSISWKWRVDEFPKRKLPEKIEMKKEEDFAARIYVIFPASFFTNSKAIEYIWAEELPVGTCGQSAYSKNIKILVLRSGLSENNWEFEERDIVSDYIKLFCEKPSLNIGAISFMTDADSTNTDASAVYDEIKVWYKNESAKTLRGGKR